MKKLLHRYTPANIWHLFLVSAFPIHVWALVLAFRDFSWVSERTNSWDAVGLISYALLVAFIESIFVLLILLLLGLLVPNKWVDKKWLVFLSVLIYLVSLWGMLGQMVFLFELSLPAGIIQSLAQNGHPLRILYMVAFAVVGGTVAGLFFAVMRSEKVQNGIAAFNERVTLLSALYFVLDIFGFVIVLIRNLAG